VPGAVLPNEPVLRKQGLLLEQLLQQRLLLHGAFLPDLLVQPASESLPLPRVVL
jgi:hypothetical protein